MPGDIVLTMAPILLGISGKAAWSFPWIVIIVNPWWTIKIVGIILLVSIGIAAFIPIIGQMPSVQTLVSGTISIMSVLGLIDQIRPELGISNISLFPGYLYMGGFLLISGITLRGGMLITATLTALMSLMGEWSEGILALIAVPVGGLFGFMPLFIYAAWLGYQIKHF
jgi:hypothetical protein